MKVVGRSRHGVILVRLIFLCFVLTISYVISSRRAESISLLYASPPRHPRSPNMFGASIRRKAGEVGHGRVRVRLICHFLGHRPGHLFCRPTALRGSRMPPAITRDKFSLDAYAGFATYQFIHVMLLWAVNWIQCYCVFPFPFLLFRQHLLVAVWIGAWWCRCIFYTSSRFHQKLRLNFVYMMNSLLKHLSSKILPKLLLRAVGN